jgi:hypothetical protein
MIERDYIMRMIQQLVQALIDIIFYKGKKDFPRALQEIRTASKSLLSVDLDIFRNLSDEQIVKMLTMVKEFGGLRCYLAGRLLNEEAEVLWLQNKAAESIDAGIKSLSLLTESVIINGVPLDADHQTAVHSAAERLKLIDLPIHIKRKLFHYYELVHEYGKAEDMLFSIVGKEPEFIEEGVSFYQRLASKTDEDLIAGKLPRGEVQQGIFELRGRKKFV